MCTCQRFVELNSEGSGIGFQCRDFIPDVALINTEKDELHLIASTIC